MLNEASNHLGSSLVEEATHPNNNNHPSLMYLPTKEASVIINEDIGSNTAAAVENEDVSFSFVSSMLSPMSHVFHFYHRMRNLLKHQLLYTCRFFPLPSI